VEREEEWMVNVTTSQEMKPCTACGAPMVRDQAYVKGPGTMRIRRVYWHCINRGCGHIIRIGEYPEDAPAVPHV